MGKSQVAQREAVNARRHPLRNACGHRVADALLPVLGMGGGLPPVTPGCLLTLNDYFSNVSTQMKNISETLR